MHDLVLELDDFRVYEYGSHEDLIFYFFLYDRLDESRLNCLLQVGGLLELSLGGLASSH